MITTVFPKKICQLITLPSKGSQEPALARHYHTIKALLENDEIARFVKWIKKRPPDFRSKNAKLK